MREKEIRKVKRKIEELEEIEEEFYEEHEELDYAISISEIEEACKKVKMQDVNKQIEVISRFYKKEGSRLRKNVKEAYAETMDILQFIDKSYIYKTPQQLIEYFEANSSKEYIKHINPKYSLFNQELSETTPVVLALLNIKYWANNSKKEKLVTLYNINNYKKEE